MSSVKKKKSYVSYLFRDKTESLITQHKSLSVWGFYLWALRWCLEYVRELAPTEWFHCFHMCPLTGEGLKI